MTLKWSRIDGLTASRFCFQRAAGSAFLHQTADRRASCAFADDGFAASVLGVRPAVGGLDVERSVLMRIATTFLLAAFLLGCSKADAPLRAYRRMTGDVAPFIVQSAISHGARPLSTNDLPKIEAECRYKRDKGEVQMYILGDHVSQIQSLFSVAFGPPTIPAKTNEDGQVSGGVYAASAVGAAIRYGPKATRDGNRYTEVLIVRQGALRP